MVKTMREEKEDPGLVRAQLDDKGREIVSKVKFAAAVRMDHGDSLGERVREMIRSEKLRQEALEAGYETFDEADDFDVDDDTMDPTTPYEEVFEGDVHADARALREEREKQEKERRAEEKEKEFAERLRGMTKDELDKLLNKEEDK